MEVNGEVLNERTANTRPEACLDISALGFWTPDQRVFLIRVFNLHAQRYRCLELKRCFGRNEKEKKRHTMSECFKLKMARSLLLCLRRTVLCLGSAKPFTREWQKWWQKREKSTCQWQQALSGRRSASRLSTRCCDASVDQDRDHQSTTT